MGKSLNLPGNFIESLSDEQKKRVKTIEDRIEQKWRVSDIIQSLDFINRTVETVPPVSPSPEFIKHLRDMYPLYGKEIRDFIDKAKTGEKSQFHALRDIIQNAVQGSSVSVVLRLMGIDVSRTMEDLFGALVVSYIAMFNRGSRCSLPKDKVFANSIELKKTHESLRALRNEWYAHVERDHGRHVLNYKIDDKRDEVILDENGPQDFYEYNEQYLIDLRKCAWHVSCFIGEDIKDKIAILKKSLKEPQKDILLKDWRARTVLQD